MHALRACALLTETRSLAYNISQIFNPIVDRPAIENYQFKIQSVYLCRVSSSFELID